jgi:hypothetical protein
MAVALYGINEHGYGKNSALMFFEKGSGNRDMFNGSIAGHGSRAV